MTWQIVLCVLLAVLIAVLLMPAGGIAEYSVNGLLVWLRFGPIHIKVYPPKARTASAEEKRRVKQIKKEGKKRARTPTGDEQKHPRGGTLPPLHALLDPSLETIGAFRRKLRIDTLYIDYIAAADDPADVALQFGGVSAGLGWLLSLMETLFRVRDRRIRTRVDFSLEKPEVYVKAGLSVRVCSALFLSLRFLWNFYCIYRKNKQDVKNKEQSVTAVSKEQ